MVGDCKQRKRYTSKNGRPLYIPFISIGYVEIEWEMCLELDRVVDWKD